MWVYQRLFVPTSLIFLGVWVRNFSGFLRTHLNVNWIPLDSLEGDPGDVEITGRTHVDSVLSTSC